MDGGRAVSYTHLIRENKALQEGGAGGDHDKLVKMTSELEATRAKLKQLENARDRDDNGEAMALRAELKKAQRRIAAVSYTHLHRRSYRSRCNPAAIPECDTSNRRNPCRWD